jgi:uncharacterized protein
MSSDAGEGPGKVNGGRKPNRLIKENSPYLLQHAYNPVEWFPWGEEAFCRAVTEDRPVFLSIGYSTCHWCHVMAHESFEDGDVAALLNHAFICIKVDREERPDIDELYMAAALVLTGSGGWPLTIIMTPDKKPFFAATYIPKETRFGMQGLLTLVPQVEKLWHTNREELVTAASQVTGSLHHEITPGEEGDAGEDLLHAAYADLVLRFDKAFGGFGSAPKFPSPHTLSFLLRYWKKTKKDTALSMALQTLDAMAMGGMYDHLGYGFHRYSTDARWLIPHFEKMLYDQALLVISYTEAYQVTRRNHYRAIAEECLAYLSREMQSPEGGFYSAEDADSEGIEGKFYLWTREEIEHLLGGASDLFISTFHVTGKGNFSPPEPGEPEGRNILYRTATIEKSASLAGIPVGEYRERINTARRKLFEAREMRVRPARDDKILTDWNGLVISAFACAAQVFEEEKYLAAAKNAADFILATMRTGSGELLHRFRNGEAGIRGVATDYAFLIAGLFDLYEASLDPGYLKSALDIQDYFTKHFWDSKSGGFFSSHDEETDLVVRQKELYDGAVPSVNSVACKNLLKFGLLTSRPEYHVQAWHIARKFAPVVEQAPAGYTGFLCALDFALAGAAEVVIVGNKEDPGTIEMFRALHIRFLPSKVVIHRPTGNGMYDIDGLTGFTGSFHEISDLPTAFVCKEHACARPVNDAGSLLSELGERE